MKIAEALEDRSCMILQNHSRLTAESSVGETTYLFNAMEVGCQVLLLADACNFPKQIIPDKVSEFTFKATAYSEGLWVEF